VIQSAAETYGALFNEPPRVDKWTFSTNGVAITGMHGIPASVSVRARSRRHTLPMKRPGRPILCAAPLSAPLCLLPT